MVAKKPQRFGEEIHGPRLDSFQFRQVALLDATLKIPRPMPNLLPT